jgi:succinate-acetate transporter protein
MSIAIPHTSSTTSSFDMSMMSQGHIVSGRTRAKTLDDGDSTPRADKHDIVTSRQPTYPSQYASREGNAGMVAILGFVMATMVAGLLDLITPRASQQSIWLYLVCFGGLMQLYAGVKDFQHGNTLTACIFLLFGFHWVSHGVLLGDLYFLANVGDTAGDSPRDAILGVYNLVFTLWVTMLTLCVYLNPHGSYLLVTILGVVDAKLVLVTIHCWSPHVELQQASGALGVFVSLISMYSFFAESLAEHGDIIPTGKFIGVKSRADVIKEMREKKLR